MSNAVNDAIAAARAEASGAAQSLPAAAQAAPAPATRPQRGPKVTLAEVVSNSPRVDHFVKVKDTGILIGDNREAQEEFLVAIRLSDVQPFYGIRYGQGGNTTYKRTYDKVTEDRTGMAWEQVVAQAQQLDDRCKGDYPAADVPMVLLEPIEGKKDAVIAKLGDTLGYTTSITGFKDFETFYQAVAKQEGLMDIPLKVRAYHIYQNRNNNEWGTIGFELLGTLDEAEMKIFEGDTAADADE